MTKELDQIMNTMIRTTDREVLKRMAKDVKRLCDDMKATYNGSRSDSTGGIKFEMAAGVPNPRRCDRTSGTCYLGPLLVEADDRAENGLSRLQWYKGDDRSMLGASRNKRGLFPSIPSRVSALEQATTILMMLQMVKSFDECGQKMRAQRWLDATVHRTSFGLTTVRDDFMAETDF